MIDLTFQPYRYDERATITPRSEKGAEWLSFNLMSFQRVQLDKPVTLSLDGAMELDALARADHLHTEGL